VHVLPLLLAGDVRGELVEARSPQLAKVVHPAIDLLESFRPQRVDAPLPLLADTHEAVRDLCDIAHPALVGPRRLEAPVEQSNRETREWRSLFLVVRMNTLDP
jgi:hypothetical protein